MFGPFGVPSALARGSTQDSTSAGGLLLHTRSGVRVRKRGVLAAKVNEPMVSMIFTGFATEISSIELVRPRSVRGQVRIRSNHWPHRRPVAAPTLAAARSRRFAFGRPPRPGEAPSAARTAMRRGGGTAATWVPVRVGTCKRACRRVGVKLGAKVQSRGSIIGLQC